MKVPFIDLKRFENGFLEVLNAEFQQINANAQFIGGNAVSQFENKCKEFLGVSYCISCANGTDAIQLALRALGVGRGDIVLVPNLTFWASFEAVVNVGAEPATIDAELSDGGISVQALDEAIRLLKPKAVIIAHLYGWGSARLFEIRSLCIERGVFLVEDGAQSFGTRYEGKSIYQNALVATCSFYPAKVLGGAGDGGAIFTNDIEIAERIRSLGNHGRTSHYGHGLIGWNSRLDSLQASFLNLSLNYINQRILSRQQSAKYYQLSLPKIGIEVMLPPKDYDENGYCNVCLIKDKKLKFKIESKLKLEGIGFANIYPGVMSKQKGAEGITKGHFGGISAENICESVLNLPLFPYMHCNELERVLEVISSAIRK